MVVSNRLSLCLSKLAAGRVHTIAEALKRCRMLGRVPLPHSGLAAGSSFRIPRGTTPTEVLLSKRWAEAAAAQIRESGVAQAVRPWVSGEPEEWHRCVHPRFCCAACGLTLWAPCQTPRKHDTLFRRRRLRQRNLLHAIARPGLWLGMCRAWDWDRAKQFHGRG